MSKDGTNNGISFGALNGFNDVLELKLNNGSMHGLDRGFDVGCEGGLHYSSIDG